VTEPEPVSRRDGRALPYQEGEQPLRNCSECGKVLATYNKHYCYQCLKPTCKRCNKGFPLCPEHLARLPSDGKEELLAAIRSERMRAKVGLVGCCIILIGFVFGLPGGILTFVSLAATGGIVMFNPLVNYDIMNLIDQEVMKKHGIKVRYSKFELGTMKICQVCGERTPAKGVKKCVICSKVLCVNCHSTAHLCPQHAGSIGAANASALERLAMRERHFGTMFFIMAAGMVIMIVDAGIPGLLIGGVDWLWILIPLGLLLLPFAFIGMISIGRRRIVRRVVSRIVLWETSHHDS
jgi:hypothetical protein